MRDSIKFVVKRRVGDHDEYLQDDDDFGENACFGPLTVSNGNVQTLRNRLTRVFHERSYAEDFVRKYERRYPTATYFVSLEIERLP
jgi:hypothetical protein